ncbi:MAG: hypothetical protein WAU45_18745 [Blastocatellia bacterium]
MNVDMSAKAVTARLKLVSQLRRLCLSLAKAKPVSSGPTDRAIDKDAGARPSPKRVLE